MKCDCCGKKLDLDTFMVSSIDVLDFEGIACKMCLGLMNIIANLMKHDRNASWCEIEVSDTTQAIRELFEGLETAIMDNEDAREFYTEQLKLVKVQAFENLGRIRR